MVWGHLHCRIGWPEGIPGSDFRRLPANVNPDLHCTHDPQQFGLRGLEGSQGGRGETQDNPPRHDRSRSATLEAFAIGPWSIHCADLAGKLAGSLHSLAYPLEVRKIIYTTDAIESLNMQMRKVIKNRRYFPNDEAALKLINLASLAQYYEKMGRCRLSLGVLPKPNSPFCSANVLRIQFEPADSHASSALISASLTALAATSAACNKSSAATCGLKADGLSCRLYRMECGKPHCFST